jgi:hypothetical protein
MLSKRRQGPAEVRANTQSTAYIYRDPAAIQSRDISNNSQKVANDLVKFKVILYNALQCNIM